MTEQNARQRAQKGPRPRRIPQRMCIACREHDAKRTYVRIVRTPEMTVEVDPTGKRNGRGAYLCRRRSCWYRAIDGAAIDKALRVEVDAGTRAVLREYARSHFAPDDDEGLTVRAAP